MARTSDGHGRTGPWTARRGNQSTGRAARHRSGRAQFAGLLCPCRRRKASRHRRRTHRPRRNERSGGPSWRSFQEALNLRPQTGAPEFGAQAGKVEGSEPSVLVNGDLTPVRLELDEDEQGATGVQQHQVGEALPVTLYGGAPPVGGAGSASVKGQPAGMVRQLEDLTEQCFLGAGRFAHHLVSYPCLLSDSGPRSWSPLSGRNSKPRRRYFR